MWCRTWLPFQSTVCSGVRVAWSLVFCVMLCWSFSVRLSFFIWPLYCLSFFDLHLLINPLVPSKQTGKVMTSWRKVYWKTLNNLVCHAFWIFIDSHLQLKGYSLKRTLVFVPVGSFGFHNQSYIALKRNVNSILYYNVLL